MDWMLKLLRNVVAIAAIALLGTSCTGAFLPSLETNPWQVVEIPVESTFSDIAFTDDPNHGWLVGNQTTLLETHDGGSTWTQQSLELGDQSYIFTSVSFKGDEGWVVGQPNILLHTPDAGKTWENIPLSEKLPGSPFIVTALGEQTAEMATDIGAIYLTKDGGRTWKALVEGAVGVVRNMSRSEDGRYVAVSSRGNFYSTWSPGQREWTPHNRENSKRLQAMGFDKSGKLWLIARGGQIQFAASLADEDWQEPINPELATSWGFLDMGYRTPEEVWVSGGSGNLLGSFDSGATWFKDQPVQDVPSNLYRVVFLSPDQGFILGQRGYVLKYVGDAKSA